jgi:hypothetical protein
MELATEVNLIELFWPKFTRTFCKLGYFINVNNSWPISIKRPSFKDIEVNSHQYRRLPLSFTQEGSGPTLKQFPF